MNFLEIEFFYKSSLNILNKKKIVILFGETQIKAIEILVLKNTRAKH